MIISLLKEVQRYQMFTIFTGVIVFSFLRILDQTFLDFDYLIHKKASRNSPHVYVISCILPTERSAGKNPPGVFAMSGHTHTIPTIYHGVYFRHHHQPIRMQKPTERVAMSVCSPLFQTESDCRIFFICSRSVSIFVGSLGQKGLNVYFRPVAQKYFRILYREQYIPDDGSS